MIQKISQNESCAKSHWTRKEEEDSNWIIPINCEFKWKVQPTPQSGQTKAENTCVESKRNASCQQVNTFIRFHITWASFKSAQQSYSELQELSH